MKQNTIVTIDKDLEKAIDILNTILLSIKPIIEYHQKPLKILKRKVSGFNEMFVEISKWHHLHEYIHMVDEEYDSLSFSEKLVNSNISAYINDDFNIAVKDSEFINKVLNTHIISKIQKHSIKSFDESELPVYTCGNQKNSTILLILPCGMPWAIAMPWLKTLSENHFVITWETRSLFVGVNGSIENYDVKDQVKDMMEIVHHFDKKDIHIFGMCGGAILALQALVSHANTFTSASLWHGDYNWNDNSILTTHQKNLKATMILAYGSIEEAANIRELICTPRTIKTLAPHLACFMMYPFIDEKLLYAYSKINEKIMDFNSNSIADDIQQKILIVTSEEDTVTHPKGSEKLSQHIQNSVYYQRKKGSHASLFDAPEELQQLFQNFITTVA